MTKKKEPTLEEAFAQLDEMLLQLESEDISLEDSFKTYEQGMQLLKYCDETIDQVEKKVLLLQENGETDEF